MSERSEPNDFTKGLKAGLFIGVAFTLLMVIFHHVSSDVIDSFQEDNDTEWQRCTCTCEDITDE